MSERKLIPWGAASTSPDSKRKAQHMTYSTLNLGWGRVEQGNLPFEWPATPFVFDGNPMNDKIKSAKKILEIGCGPGRNLPWFIENTEAQYFGVDPNEGMIKYFKSINGEHADRYYVTTEFDEEIKSHQYDLVVSTFVFQHIGYRPKPPAMNIGDITQEIRKLTKPGTIWFLWEHDREEIGWIEKWLEQNQFDPIFRAAASEPYFDKHEYMRKRGSQHHIILVIEE